jgi:phage-related protein
MSTFTYSPAPGATLTAQPRVRTATFGDGYSQRVADGINTRPRIWSLTFTRATSDIDAIDAFLVARNGVESFDWTPPKGAAGKWICKSWSQNVIANTAQSITANFEEVFGD